MPRPVPADLEDALAESPAARERFWAMPPEQMDAWVGWVDRARLPRTRRRRVAEAVRRLAGPATTRRTAVATNGAGPAPVPRQRWGVWLIGLVLLGGLAAFLVWLTAYRHHDSKTGAVVVTAKARVPGVVGIRYQAAQFQLKEAKLAAKVVHKPSKKPKGIVIAQNPKNGKTVPQGTPVTLVVSKGPPGVKMPDVVGLAAADAVKALQERKLLPTLRQTASQEAPGTVLAQVPKAGAHAKSGTKVVLQVAKGQAAVPVPSVTGQPQQQAAATLQAAGLKATAVQVPSSQPSGTVVAQSPSAGQKAAKGSAVRVNVSRGPATTTTSQSTTTAASTTPATKAPASGNDYTGTGLSVAIQKLARARQQAIVQYVASSEPAGVVVASSRAGSRERLQVSAGPHPQQGRAVPDVSGEDRATAEQDLQAAGFSFVEAKWPVSDQTLNGTVVAETPSAGEQVPRGAAIAIYLGSYD